MFQVLEDFQLSKNFKLKEFACKDGSKFINVDYRLIDKLQQLRDFLGKGIIISSGFRTASYNKSCGGIKTSLHLTGQAADIKVSGMSPRTVAKFADQFGFTGIGIYPTFTHVDVGSKQLYWRQDSKGVKTFYKSLDAMK